ncbi:sucrase ferredoxin [Jatrophihabitans sp.]|uniref:sucrase ferredoxin n=1 Tax=Jatrophihabitans sp. TaxID=1932789 RepID=UPI002C2594AB|nr:sucrase ferredoxin [Jatrophihabitans sp.]
MLDQAHRCGLAAAARGDEMLGTAFPADRILLVEQPGGWGLAGLAGSRFGSQVAQRLISTFGRQGVRVLAIRHPGRHPAADRHPDHSWGFADCRPGRQGIVWGTYRAAEELLELDPAELADRAGQAGTGEPVYAVCTHGTRDMCCAIEGRPVATALARECPGRVWECSHVGGDRFAANVLVLPTGQLYGRVTDPVALVAASEVGQVLPDQLRGQIGLPPAAQAAVVHAQRELELATVGAVRVLHVQGAPPDVQLVRLAVPGGSCTVAVRRVVGAPATLTCRDAKAKVPLSYRPLWLRAD